MKHSGLLFIFVTILLLAFFIPQKANSESSVTISNNGEGATSNVDVTTNTGGNTICVNGKCTTSNENNGKSTVCINGKCQTSEDGNLDVQSDDGTAKVNIKNNSSSVKIEQNSNSKIDVKVDQSALGASTEDSSNAAAKEKAKEEVKKAKEEAGEEKFKFSDFIQKQMEFLRKIVTFQFLFGDK